MDSRRPRSHRASGRLDCCSSGDAAAVARASAPRATQGSDRHLAQRGRRILCLELGLDLVPRAEPNQGVQKEIDLFGSREWVGFYNSFVAKCAASAINVNGAGNVEVSRDVASNEVHALRGDRFASIQFHAESLLTRRGVDIIASNVKRVLAS